MLKIPKKCEKKIYFFLTIFLFFRVVGLSLVFADGTANNPINFGEKNGKVSFSSGDNDIRITTSEITFETKYKVLSLDIQNILKNNLTTDKFNKENSVIINQLGVETISGTGANVTSPILLYGNDTKSAKNSLYISSEELFMFKEGLIVLNKKFTDTAINFDKSLFVAKAGFKVEGINFPFMIANITGTQGFTTNSYVTSFISTENSDIVINNRYILTENNDLVENVFSASKNGGDINLIDTEDTTIVDSSLVSYNDKYTTSYAKTNNGSINVRKNIINISNSETGGVFFDATGGDVTINTVVTDKNNGSIAIVLDKDNKLKTFAKATNNVNITTGTVDIDTTAILKGLLPWSSSSASVSFNFAGDNKNKNTVVEIKDRLTIKSQNDYSAELETSFFKGCTSANITLGSLELNNVYFGSKAFLVESKNIELTINDIKTDLLEKIKNNLFSSNKDTESIVLNLSIMGNGNEFNGFDYSNKPLKKATFAIDTSKGKFISNNVLFKSNTNNLDLTFNFYKATTNNLIFSDNSYLVDSSGATILTINRIHPSLVEKILPRVKVANGLTIKSINLSDVGNVNFNFSKIPVTNGITIDGSLINSKVNTTGPTTLNFDFSGVTTNNLTFSDNSYLVDSVGATILTINRIHPSLVEKILPRVKVANGLTIKGINLSDVGDVNFNFSKIPVINGITIDGSIINSVATDGTTTLTFDFSGVTANNLIFSDDSYLVNSAGTTVLTIDKIHPSLVEEILPRIKVAKNLTIKGIGLSGIGNVNFNFSKILSNNNAITIDGSLINSKVNTGPTTLNFDFSGITTNNLIFSDNSYLVDSTGNTEVTFNNTNTDLLKMLLAKTKVDGNLTINGSFNITNGNFTLDTSNLFKLVSGKTIINNPFVNITDNNDVNVNISFADLTKTIEFKNSIVSIGASIAGSKTLTFDFSDVTTNNLILSNNGYLVDSTDNISLKITNMNKTLLNDLVSQMVKTDGNLIFSGFNFTDKDDINNLDLSKLFDNVKGSITLTDPLVKSNGNIIVNLGELLDKEYIFRKDIILTEAEGNVIFAADFKNVDVNKFSLFDNNFLVNSAGNVELTLSNISEALATKLSGQMVKTDGNLIFSGFEFIGKGDIEDLNISGLFDNVDGSITIDGSLVKNTNGNIAVNLGILPNKNYLFKDDIIKTEAKGNIVLSINLKNIDVNNFNLTDGKFLVNSAGDTTINLGNINEKLANKLIPQMVKTNGNLIFSGFDFSNTGIVKDLRLTNDLFKDVKGNNIILTGPLVKNNNGVKVFLKLIDKEYIFNDDIIRTDGNSNINLTIDFANITKADNFNLANDKFLVNSVGNATMNLSNITEELANKLSKQMVKASSNFTFNGFDFEGSGAIKNLDLSGLFDNVEGSVTINSSLVKNSNNVTVDLGVLSNKKYTFNGNIIETSNDGNINLTVNFEGVSTSNFNLADGKFLVNSTGNVNLNINGSANIALLNRLAPQMINTKGKFTFSGFELSSNDDNISNLDLTRIFDNVGNDIIIKKPLAKISGNNLNLTIGFANTIKTIKFEDDVVLLTKTINDNDESINTVGVTIDFGNINDLDKFNLTGGKFLVNSTDNISLKIININKALLNDLVPQIVKADGNLTFSGFDFTDKGDIDNLDISNIFNNVKGSITLTNPLVKNNKDVTLDLGELLDKEYVFKKDIVLTETEGKVVLTAAFKNVDVNKFNLSEDSFLINSAKDATLDIYGINEALTTKLAPQMVKANGNFTFNGFDFTDKGNIENLNLSGLFSSIGGSITINGSLINNNNNITVDLGVLPNKKYTFNDDFVKTIDRGDIDFAINFTNITNANNVVLIGKLINSAGNTILNLGGINEELANKLALRKIRAAGNLTFSGFDFRSKGIVNNLYLPELFKEVVGSITLTNSLVKNNKDVTVDLGELLDKEYIFRKDIVLTETEGKVVFAADFKNVDVNKFNLSDDSYLVNSAGDVELTLLNVSEALATKLSGQIVKTNGNFIFNGFDFRNTDIINNLNLSGLFSNINGSITINGSLVKNNNDIIIGLGALPNKNYLFEDDIIKTEDKGNVELTINFTNIISADNFNLTKDNFLISSVGDATLVISGMNEALATKLAPQMVKAGGNLIFSGFDFIGKGNIEDLNISGIFDNIGGSITIDGSLVKNTNGNIAVNLGILPNKNYLFKDDIIKTEAKGNIVLSINLKNIDVNNFNLTDGKFLVNSAGDTTINLGNINEKLANKLIPQMVKTNGNLIFSGFDFSNTGTVKDLKLTDNLFKDVKGDSITLTGPLVTNNNDIKVFLKLIDKKYTFNDDIIKTTTNGDDINLTIDFANITKADNFNLANDKFLVNSVGNATMNLSNITEELANKLSKQMVKASSNFTFNGFDFEGSGAIKNLDLSGLFDNVNGSVIINGSLVKNNDSTTVVLPHNKQYLFKNDNIALAEITGNDKMAIIDNGSSDLHINKLNVDDEAFINTAIVLMTGDEVHKAEIKSNKFILENSKIGAIVIDETTSKDGSGVIITSNGDLTILNNKFLQSIVVAPKQAITITSKNSINISKNTIYKAIVTDKNIVIGGTSSAKTIFNENEIAENTENYFIKADGGIKFLGKEIEIKNNKNHINSSNYGLFYTNKNIEIGDDKTENIAIFQDKTRNVGNNIGANLMASADGIRFKSSKIINFTLGENSWKKALYTDKGEISFISETINITGDGITNTSNSHLINFAESENLIIGEKNITKNINLSAMTLNKNNGKYFFKVRKDISIAGREYSGLKMNNLVSGLSDSDGAVFAATDGNILLNIGSLDVNLVKTPNSAILRQNNAKSADLIAIDNVNFDNSNMIGGMYHGIGNSLRIRGYGENDYMNLNFTSEIDGKAIIKFGNEKDNANEVQYSADTFTMKVGDFKLNPVKVGNNTKAGIIFTNPRYIETDSEGNVADNGIRGDLKIMVADGCTLDLTMPNNLPSIAVIAKRQNYGEGIDQKVFEFGETVIEGASLISEGIPAAISRYITVKMSGYNSLETNDFNNISEYGNIVTGETADETAGVGKSKLTIGNNVREFDTGAPGSQYVLHEFEMRSGMMIIRLNNDNKNVDLFKWAGNYRTLTNGANNKDTIVNKGKIILRDNVKLDIEGENLQGDFTLISADNFEFIYDGTNLNDLLDCDNDRIFETREVVHFDNSKGFVVRLGLITGDNLVESLERNGGLNDLEAKVLASLVENSRLLLSTDNKNSSESNFDIFSRNIYDLARVVLGNKQEDKTRVTNIINNIQIPDVNENNSGMIGTIGLSSLKAITDVLSDRIFENAVSVNYADSGTMLLASNGGRNNIVNKSNNSINIFAKINYGFGKLEIPDKNRDISNYGIILGSDFGLLENKMTLGISFMFDSTSLDDIYRNSKINSLVMSLYSKYDILESNNKDKLFVYGIVSYVRSSENEETAIDYFHNKSDKSANIIAVDVLGGYNFNSIGVTPEFGIGFISGSRDNYCDDLGQTISSKDNTYLSLKTNIRYDIPMGNLSEIIAIGLKLGMSYDILSNGTNGFDVETPTKLKYHVDDAEGADRLSFSYGINVSYNINAGSKLSLSYNGTKTEKLLNNKFSFEYRYKIK